MYASQLRSVPVGLYEYYVYLVDVSVGSVHSNDIAAALQDLAIKAAAHIAA